MTQMRTASQGLSHAVPSEDRGENEKHHRRNSGTDDTGKDGAWEVSAHVLRKMSSFEG